MPDLENQLTDIVDMILDDYGSRVTSVEVSEVIGLILENISGFDTVDSQILTQVRTYTITGTRLQPSHSVDSGTGRFTSGKIPLGMPPKTGK